MKKITLLAITIASISLGACNKNDDTVTDNFETLKTEVLADFTNVVAVKGYADLDNAASALNTAIQNLNTNATEANLTEAKNAWKNMRSIWEKCEGYLFGPVEDNDYDPNMDTWPTDYVQMDSLLASSNPLTVADIQNITLSLRGYHLLNTFIFGDRKLNRSRAITARQKAYMVSLSADLKNTCHELYLSWTCRTNQFAQQVINAGNGSAV
ncbi:MAG: imelysin family protein [Ferruginibacter sp.]